MADELIARFRRWFEYERDVHAKVIASLDSVPPDRKAGAEYCRAVGILGHIVGARAIWLHRLGILPTAPPSLALEEDADLGRIIAAGREIEAAWTNYLAGLTDADLTREFEYQSFDGGRFCNCIEEILATLYGHSWYHRGQIAMLVRAAGGTPAITDFIYWCRQPVDGKV
jgi:uncharacterized damage-inducible protein DinB